MQYLVVKMPHAYNECISGNTNAVKQVIKNTSHDTMEVDVSEALRQAQNGPVVFLAPGARAADMISTLRPSEVQGLRHAVSRGSGYLGFCASGYAGVEVAEIYTKRGGEDKCYDVPMLGLVAGIQAVGPAFASYTGSSVANSETLATWVNTSYGRRVKSGWNHGPSFSGGEIVATYEGVTRKPAAIVQGTRGTGVVVLSGVHPEMECAGETDAEMLDRQELFGDLLDRVTPNV